MRSRAYFVANRLTVIEYARVVKRLLHTIVHLARGLLQKSIERHFQTQSTVTENALLLIFRFSVSR